MNNWSSGWRKLVEKEFDFNAIWNMLGWDEQEGKWIQLYLYIKWEVYYEKGSIIQGVSSPRFSHMQLRWMYLKFFQIIP